MDKQVMSVILSLTLYVLYVLLPMIPSIVIYRMFPDTKVSATGILANLNFKTTGAFAAYVVTVFLGFFLVQNTHHLIAQISSPVWTLKTKVALLNHDGSTYSNKYLLETLVVSIEPKLQQVSGDEVILSLPGSKKSWETTRLKFDIPHFGYNTVTISDVAEKAKIDDYELFLKLTNPISITADEQVTRDYPANYAKKLTADNTAGPKPINPGGN